MLFLAVNCRSRYLDALETMARDEYVRRGFPLRRVIPLMAGSEPELASEDEPDDDNSDNY